MRAWILFIYLIPGHGLPGFKMNGKYYAIESTGIGGEGMGGRFYYRAGPCRQA